MRLRAGYIGVTAVTLVFLSSSTALAAQTHVVQPGDTLWGIASRYRVSVGALASANGLADPDVLRLGQRLIVPANRKAVVKPAPQPAAGAVPRRQAFPASPIPSRGAMWASALVSKAVRYVGVRYRWGGITPRGFDCSGFITHVLGVMGIRVPRTTYAMYADGQPVMRDSLQVGDIVFFQTIRPGPSHAGMYIGNNQFIHSSSGFGRVTVTSLDYRYYKPRYLGARRFH